MGAQPPRESEYTMNAIKPKYKWQENIVNPLARPDEFDSLCDKVYELASRGMSAQETAAAVHSTVETLAIHSELTIAFRKGRAEFAFSLRNRAHQIATDDPQAYDDPLERSQIRKEQTSMIKTLLQFVENDKLPSIELQEKTKRLSNEELDAKIAEQEKNSL